MPPTIEVRNISKMYKLGGGAPAGETFREFLTRSARAPWNAFRRLGAPSQDRNSFWALRELNFDVHQGDVLGIIGANGAGKSTLLKILSRITDPTSGEVRINGRLASLLEVGTGFHPELTGRENIFLNGAILGMRRLDILRKFDEIVEFAEIANFIDTPVKHYSSGMYVRLAFAVAAHLDPEVLVIDEVLAVGDLAFQRKCLGKMSEVSQGGRTVLFVSHNMAALENLCRRGIVLKKGVLDFDGGAKEAIDHYLHTLYGGAESQSGKIIDLTVAAGRPHRHKGLLQSMELLTDGDRPVKTGLPLGAALKIRLRFNFENPTNNFNVGIGFDNLFGQRIFTAHSLFEPQRDTQPRSGPQTYCCLIPSFTLFPGEYRIRVWLDIANSEVDLVDDAARLNVIEADFYGTGKSAWNGTFVLPHRWFSEDPVTVKNATLRGQATGSTS